MRAAHYCSRSLFRPSSRRIGTTMPSADFCRPVRIDHSTLSPDFGTDGRSPEVSSTAFRTQPADLQPVPLMDMGFAVIRRLARHRMPLIRFLSIGSYVCSTLLSDPASPRHRCASLSLHLHQVVKGTFTPKLSNMLGTLKKILRPPRRPQDLVFIIVHFQDSWSFAEADFQGLPHEFQPQLKLPHGASTGDGAKGRGGIGRIVKP